MVNPNFPVPDQIPGQLITDRMHLGHLKDHLSNLCGLRGSVKRFPGSQPVSFTTKSLELLENEDFWVCEKSDGVRVMVLVVVMPTPQGLFQEVYFINRKEEFYLINNVMFPHHENLNRFLKDTIIDGELVIDVDPKTLQHQLRFLAFDCIVWEGDNLMKKPLINRYGRLKEWVIKPMKKLLELQPHLIERMPFDVKLKSMELAYGIDKVFHQDLPKLTHGNDGLIFTSATAPYTIGTDPKILKWKPPSENSIDFRLELRFPPMADDPSEPDFYQKPLFVLMMNCGRDGEQYFDLLEMSDEEWFERKRRREQLDNRVVEVVWDFEKLNWKLLRFRDDKITGNFRDVVYAIIGSIKDGVEADELCKRSPQIRKAWKARIESASSRNKSSTFTTTHENSQRQLPTNDNLRTQQQQQQQQQPQNNPQNDPYHLSNNKGNHSRYLGGKPENSLEQPSKDGTLKIKILGGDPRSVNHKLINKYQRPDRYSLASSLKRF